MDGSTAEEGRQVVVVDEAVERHAVGEAEPGDEVLELTTLRAFADDVQAEAGVVRAERVDGADDQVDPLVRNEAAQDRDPLGILGRRVAGTEGRQVRAVGEQTDGAGPAELGAHLLDGRPRDCDDPTPAVDQRHQDPLEPPAEDCDRCREVRAELLLVDVVHHQHHRSTAPQEQRREGREAARRVDHRVDLPPPGEQPECGVRVERERSAAAPDDDVVADDRRRLSRLTSGEELHLGPGLAQGAGELPGVDLGPAGQRVLGVAPVDDRHPPSGEGGRPRHGGRGGHLRPRPATRRRRGRPARPAVRPERGAGPGTP